MADIIKEFANIGRIQKAQVLQTYNIYNDADLTAKVYFLEVSNICRPQITPRQNIVSDDFVVARYQQSSSRKGYLYPNAPGEHKKNGVEGVVNALRDGLKNFLDYCPTIYPTCQKESAYQNMLWLFHYLKNPLHLYKVPCVYNPNLSTSYMWFKDITDLLRRELSKISAKGEKPYVGLSYQGRCMSEIYPELFERKIFDSNAEHIKGDDFFNKDAGFGGNPELNFMTVDQLPKSMIGIKSKLLPLSHGDATYIKNGFQFFEKQMTFNLYYPLTKTILKIGVLPTVLANHNELEIDEIYQKIYDEYNVIQNRHSRDDKDMKEAEESIIYSMLPELEDLSEYENNLPVINTIIIYEQSSQKRTMHLTIPDVLPSYLLKQSELLRELSLMLFPIKDRKEPKLSELFQDYIETFEVMFSHKKLVTDTLVAKLTKTMLFGTARSNAVNEQYYPFINFIRLCSSKSEYTYERTIRDPDVVVRIVTFFNKMDKITQPIILRKEKEDGMVWKLNDTDSFESAVEQYLKQTVFIYDEKSLQVMYLLGMLSAALIKWQLGVMKGTSSFGKWLNNLGQISEKSSVRIFDKFSEGYLKTKQTASGFDNCKIEVLLTHYTNAYRDSKDIVQKSSDKATMAFMFGMSDYKNIVKVQRTCNGKIAQENQDEIIPQGEEQ